MTASIRPAHKRYSVRKQSSGRTFSETFYVYDNVSHGRVSVHPFNSRSAAAAQAETLNIGNMVPDASLDSRPYEVRLMEAVAQYRELAR